MEVKQVEYQVISFATTLGLDVRFAHATARSNVGARTRFGELGRGSTDLESHPEPALISSP